MPPCYAVFLHQFQRIRLLEERVEFHLVHCRNDRNSGAQVCQACR